jgi:nitrogen fixation protein NifU and related proteins
MSAIKTENKLKESISGTATQFWLSPYNEGRIEEADGWATVTGPCGDTMEISLRIDQNQVKDSRFRVKGCAVSRACASNAAALAKGKELEEAWDITEDDIARDLPEIPVDHRHCTILARDTLRLALESFIKRTRKEV